MSLNCRALPRCLHLREVQIRASVVAVTALWALRANFCRKLLDEVGMALKKWRKFLNGCHNAAVYVVIRYGGDELALAAREASFTKAMLISGVGKKLTLDFGRQQMCGLWVWS
jgi:hypothetical protein